MKANELMIGEWVMTPAGIAKVLKIDGDDNTIVIRQHDGRLNGGSVDETEPIPLTPEILEANGFTRYSVVHFNLQQWVLNEGNGCRVSLYQDVKSGKWAIKDFWIDYVHELQHILRLCKIEKEIML